MTEKSRVMVPLDEVPIFDGKGRGQEVSISPEGALPENLPPHLLRLMDKHEAIRLQFQADPAKERVHLEDLFEDPLNEDQHKVTEYSVVKYGAHLKNGELWRPGRMLLWATLRCGAYCRFCTRGREVGESSSIPKNIFDQNIEYLRAHPEINEVILSGGDPLTINPRHLDYITSRLAELQQEGSLERVRIGTRLPIHNPEAIDDRHINAIRKLENPRMMIHINHPEEIRGESESRRVFNAFKQAGAMLYSQSVLLNGVNYFEDEQGNPDPATLMDLAEEIDRNGIVPYLLFQNDQVPWATHFTVPIRKAIKMWQGIRPKMSGLTDTWQFVIDVPGGAGKIPIPKYGFTANIEEGFIDYNGQRFYLDDELTAIPEEEYLARLAQGLLHEEQQ